MKLVLDQIEWADGEAYAVRVDLEDNAESVTGVLAHLWRRHDESDLWRFNPGKDFDPAETDVIKIKAPTLEAAKEAVLQRTEFMKLPSDRLAGSTMGGYTDSVMTSLAALAGTTKTRPDFLHSLTKCIAACIVSDMEPDGHEEFLNLFARELRAQIATMMEAIKAKEAFAKGLAEVLTRVRVAEDATKH